MTESVPDPLMASNPDNDFIRRIRLIEGDIARQSGIDAIATTVDITLDTKRSLNRAIIEGAGQALDDSILDHIYRPQVGDVYVLPGYNLSVQHVLVAVTPIWKAGFEGEDRDLLRCYRGIMEMAERMKLKSLALPALGTGKHKFPVARAARLALQGMKDRIPQELDELRIVCNRADVYKAFADRLAIIAQET